MTSKLTLSLPEKFKSFPEGFQFEFEGSLILLLGVNGSGKTQLLNAISRFDHNINSPFNAEVSLNGMSIDDTEIAYRSFSQNVSLKESSKANSQIIDSTFQQVINNYNKHKLNSNNHELREFKLSTKRAKEILVEKYGEEAFDKSQIDENMIKSAIDENDFVWKNDDFFANTISEIFFTYALKRFELYAQAGKEQNQLTDTDIVSKLGIPPWQELNSLFEELNFNYRFKDNYSIKSFSLDEQPILYQLDPTGRLDPAQKRPVSMLSDGEKAILSLCFGSLNGSRLQTKKLLLLDEIDAVLNPSLVEMFFKVIERYFISKNCPVILATHSLSTIALAPDYATHYEVSAPHSPLPRIAQIDRDDFAELRLVNLRYLERSSSLRREVDNLRSQLDNKREILFITEGLTDWRHLIRALRFFHESGEFENIFEEYFLHFGTQDDVSKALCGTDCFVEMGDGTLKKYLEGLIASRKVEASITKTLRIGVFDSDKGGNTPNDESLNVRSFKIRPDGISIEFLYSQDEIETVISGRKLYIGTEFSEETLKHKANPTLSLGKNSRNDAGKKKIIDNDVFDASDNNIALPKSEFANHVFNGDLEISDESFERFRHIFEELSNYVDAYKMQSTT